MTKGKKIASGIIIAFAVVVVAVLAIAATKPDDFHYERSIVIDAPIAGVYGQVAVIANWEHWSPWANLDPSAKMTYEGPPMDKGATMRWDGNMSVGKGSMTVTDSERYTHVTYHLVFEKPMKGEADSNFTFEMVNPRQTNVIWSMYGKQNYMSKVMGTIMNCEKMMNREFDKGLAKLKEVSEVKK